jgi:hypothetical protein
MHVWTQAEFLHLILTLRQRFDDVFDLEAAARVGIEFIVVLRKAGPLPEPPTPSPPESIFDKTVAISRRALSRGRTELRKRRAKP